MRESSVPRTVIIAMLSVFMMKMGLFINCMISYALDDANEIVSSPNVTPKIIISIGVVRTSKYFTSATKTPAFGLTKPTLIIRSVKPS